MTFLNRLCWHDWGFPRRRPEFQDKTNVDVQTCAKCGTRRISTIQFGPPQNEQVESQVSCVGEESHS